MIKKIFVSICLLLAIASFAQEGTSSPYSFYGIGDVKFKGTIENRSMGGVSVFQDSIHLNIQNPASYANLRQTSFSVATNYNSTNLTTATSEDKTTRTNLDYLLVGLPLGKFGASFGLMPYSSIGYRVHSRDDLAGTDNVFYGSGGINKLFIGLAYQVNKKLSIGANVDYNFGKVNSTSYFYRDNVQFGTRETNFSNVRGGGLTLGAMYHTKFRKKSHLFGAFTFSPETNLNYNNTRNIATLQNLLFSSDIVVETTPVDSPNTSVKMPTKLSFGIGIGELRKWQIGTQLTWQQSSRMSERFNDITNVSYENAAKLSLGGFYIPKFNSYNSYFAKVCYRAGFYHQNTGLVINGQSINDTAFTLGLGLPLLSGTFSNINLGLEIGKRGTRNNGLIQENYTNFSIGFSFNDRWFIKRRYE